MKLKYIQMLIKDKEYNKFKKLKMPCNIKFAVVNEIIAAPNVIENLEKRMESNMWIMHGD